MGAMPGECHSACALWLLSFTAVASGHNTALRMAWWAACRPRCPDSCHERSWIPGFYILAHCSQAQATAHQHSPVVGEQLEGPGQPGRHRSAQRGAGHGQQCAHGAACPLHRGCRLVRGERLGIPHGLGPAAVAVPGILALRVGPCRSPPRT